MITVISICQAAGALGALLCVARIVMGPSVADRAAALDTLLVVVTAEVALGAARAGDGRYLDFMLAVALVGFVGSTAVGRFVERRGAR